MHNVINNLPVYTSKIKQAFGFPARPQTLFSKYFLRAPINTFDLSSEEDASWKAEKESDKRDALIENKKKKQETIKQAGLKLEPLKVTTKDKVSLDVNILSKQNPTQDPKNVKYLIIFCGANIRAQEDLVLSPAIHLAKSDINVVLVNYQGVGNKSDPIPAENIGSLIDNGEAVWQTLREEKKAQPENTTAYGLCMGAMIATCVAEKHKLRLISDRCPASLPHIAASWLVQQLKSVLNRRLKLQLELPFLFKLLVIIFRFLFTLIGVEHKKEIMDAFNRIPQEHKLCLYAKQDECILPEASKYEKATDHKSRIELFYNSEKDDPVKSRKTDRPIHIAPLSALHDKKGESALDKVCQFAADPNLFWQQHQAAFDSLNSVATNTNSSSLSLAGA